MYRGDCFFQTKWEYCNAAGAIGTVLVLLDDSTDDDWLMWGNCFNPLLVITVTLPLVSTLYAWDHVEIKKFQKSFTLLN